MSIDPSAAALQPPPDAEPYKQTRSFTEETVPATLLNEHSTKDGVWGLIHVEQGKLRYCVTSSAVRMRSLGRRRGSVTQ